jgi:hypothetical protein
VTVRLCDEFDWGFGWLTEERIPRTSHALLAAGGVWIIDPVDGRGVRERIHALGQPAAVVQLLDRHERDCGELARRLGVPLHVTPFDGVEGAPFRFLDVRRNRLWKEVALWWQERRVLVCGDAVGTLGYFRAGEEPLGVHPFLRLRPPRRLAALAPEHVLTGHGQGVHGPEAAAALEEALRTARRRIPRWVAGLPTASRR